MTRFCLFVSRRVCFKNKKKTRFCFKEEKKHNSCFKKRKWFVSEQKNTSSWTKKEEPLKKKGCLFQEPLVSRIQRKAVRVSSFLEEFKGLLVSRTPCFKNSKKMVRFWRTALLLLLRRIQRRAFFSCSAVQEKKTRFCFKKKKKHKLTTLSSCLNVVFFSSSSFFERCLLFFFFLNVTRC